MVQAIQFRSRALPSTFDELLRHRLAAAHRAEPLSVIDPRATVRRVAAVAEDIGVHVTVYRGGLGLCGSEVDHIWLEVDGRVVDAAFPLFADEFVDVLRSFVAGDASSEELAAAAVHATLEERVLGLFPATASYLGQPVWGHRS